MSMTLPDIASIASWRLERASRPNGGGVKLVYFGRCTGYAASQPAATASRALHLAHRDGAGPSRGGHTQNTTGGPAGR